MRQIDGDSAGRRDGIDGRPRFRRRAAAAILLGLMALAGSGPAAAAPGLTLEEALRRTLAAGPQRRDIELSADRAEAGQELAESAFRWRVGVGSARIPQLVELSEQFGAALGDLGGQVSAKAGQAPPPAPTITPPGQTGLSYDTVNGRRWAVLPGVSASRTFSGGGQLTLSTHWGIYGPLNEASRQEDGKAEWQPFDKLPLAQFAQPLFRSPATLDPGLRRDEAARNVRRDRSAAALTETRALLDLVQTYFAAAQAQDEVEAASRALAQAQTEARVRQDKAWRKDATGLDLMEADVFVQRAVARVEAGRHALDLARQRLNRLLGRPLGEPLLLAPPAGPPEGAGPTFVPAAGATFGPAGSPPVDPAQVLAAALAEAAAARPEVALAQSAVESAAAQRSAAEEASRAQVTASAGVTKEKSWTVGLDVQWPLYDGGAGRAQVRAAEAALASAEKALADRREEIALQVTQAYYARLDARRGFEVAELAAERARKAAELARERLGKGAATNREVTAAEDALFEAEASGRAALYRWHQAEWAWLAARGRLPGSLSQ